MRKSLSIPVHLTVSRAESSALPYALRPDPFCDDDYERRHDRQCALAAVCSRSSSAMGFSQPLQSAWTKAYRQKSSSRASSNSRDQLASEGDAATLG